MPDEHVNGAETPQKLALHDRHEAAGARFTPFSGWEMPLQYTGIIDEHQAVRTHAGVFDVSHLGRVILDGPNASHCLRSVTTYNVLEMQPGQAHYSLYCDDTGGIVDDIFIYRLAEERWLIVQNAANHAQGLALLAKSCGASVEDVTESTVMLAVQGPEAGAALTRVLGKSFQELATRRCTQFPWHDTSLLVARTGYTGEDGAECTVERSLASELWDDFLAVGVKPAGLGARDTLRLEAALPLHGNDIDLSTNPFEAGLGWVVSMNDDAPFIGRNSLERLGTEAPSRQLSHMRLLDRGVPRHGYPVLDANSPSVEPVATLTSGAFSPTLRTGIGMAYLPVTLAESGARLMVEIHGRAIPAEVVPRPFYRRNA